MVVAIGGQALDRSTLQRYTVQAAYVGVATVDAAGAEVRPATGSVHTQQVAHRPVAAGELAQHFAVGQAHPVQMAPTIALREPHGGVLPGQDGHRWPVVGIHVELQASVAGFFQNRAQCTAVAIDLHQAQPARRAEVRDHGIQPIAVPTQDAGLTERVPALGQRDVMLPAAAGIHHKQGVAHLLCIAQHPQLHGMHARPRAVGRAAFQIGVVLQRAFVVADAGHVAPVRRPANRERPHRHSALTAWNTAQGEVRQHAIAITGFSAVGQCPWRRARRLQPQVVVAHLQPRIADGRRQCIGRRPRIRRTCALPARPLAIDGHFSAEPQAQAIVRLLHAGQAQAWPAGTERRNRSVQRSGFEQGLACRLDGIDQYRLAPALSVFALIPESSIGQPVGQDRSIAQRTAQMTVMHAFGALVVGRLQRTCSVWRQEGNAGKDSGADTRPQRIGNEQGNLLLQSSKDYRCTRAARVCQTEPESSPKIQQCEDHCFQGALWRITENLHSRCDGALALLHTIRK